MRILIVDDDEPFRLALRNAFVRRGYEVLLAGSPAEADATVRDISEAARRLKMHRRTLQRKLQKHPPKA